MFPVQEISAIDLAFPGDVTHLMPVYADIPSEFKNGNNRFCRICSQWFYNGLPSDAEFTPVPGIDGRKAFQHIYTILRSFQPKHEHKMAAVSYLMSQWFSDIKIPEKAAS